MVEAGGGTATVEVAQVGTPLDADEDGLIEVSTLEQLNAIRYDLDGDGEVEDDTNEAAYSTAFGTRLPVGIIRGYELVNDLNFNDVSSYASATINMDWTTGSGWSSYRVL